MKLIALTDVGRVKPLCKGKTFEGTFEQICKRLECCFINGCEIKRQGKTDNWKVFAGWGGHVADIKIEGYDEAMKKQKVEK